MDQPVRKHIVISAVNIRKGGTLTVLLDCLKYLSSSKYTFTTALVHSKDLIGIPGIEYIEIPWSTKSWLHRLWCEYVTMYKISKTLQPVDLWFSLHDTTPRVQARRQAVYCHTSFPFMKLKWQDWFMDAKIPLFRLLTRFAYQINVRKNRYLVVQQEWMRESLSHLISYPQEKIIVAPPAFYLPDFPDTPEGTAVPIFFYPATPDCHKNFETLCEAAELLQDTMDTPPFKLVLTIDGTENRYAARIKSRFGHVRSIDFHGYMPKQELYEYYAKASCLVFPSRVETWGLPISEFKPTGKPMILADLPYAHETAEGARRVVFFPVEQALTLAVYMYTLLKGNHLGFMFESVPARMAAKPYADNWDHLFHQLLYQ